jgi:hypothetical protein
MKRAILVLVAAWTAYAQTPDPAITFEVASVKEYSLRSLPRSSPIYRLAPRRNSSGQCCGTC